jgi:ribose transport system ATP-binding protein
VHDRVEEQLGVEGERPVESTNVAVEIDVRTVSKTFQGQRALDSASLELRRGEIHGLLGQNGSGKSTLIKILAGYHQPDHGASALVRDEPFDLGSVSAASSAGIRFIHQDLGLVGEMDSVDNLALSGAYSRSWWLSDRLERRAAVRLLGEYGLDLDIDPRIPMTELSAAQRTLVATVRAVSALDREDGVLVLDEPTAALPDREVRHLFGLVRRLRDRGMSVLFVTHRLGEVFELCDRVTVLRNGRNVATRSVHELEYDELVELIIGRPLEAFYPPTPSPVKTVLLEVTDLAGQSVSKASLSVHAGEIVGVTGLVGSGYESLLGMIFGAVRPDAGSITVCGRPVPAFSPPASIANGLGYASADRKRLDGLLDWTVRENLTLPQLRRRRWSGWLSARAERKDTEAWVQRAHVAPPNTELLFGALSGGNQQKVILARWLRCGSRVFILEEPTAGIDLGSKHAIYEQLAETAAEGAGVLLSSSDTEELCAVCDRVLVMRNGVVASVLQGEALTVDSVTHESLRL